jgi:hypothetical protein
MQDLAGRHRIEVDTTIAKSPAKSKRRSVDPEAVWVCEHLERQKGIDGVGGYHREGDGRRQGMDRA